MRRGLGIFWTLYMLFFAVPFPMILYYNIKNEDPPVLYDINPLLALGIVLVSVILWCMVLGSWLYRWIIVNFKAKSNIQYLVKHGVSRKAEILDVVKVSRSGSKYNTYELVLSFKNLVNTEIRQKAFVNDAKPQQHRFEKGKTVEIRIDKDVKRPPYFIFAESEARINILIIFLISMGWLTIIVLVAGYYIYAYLTENDGMGWRFITYWHPLVICPAILLFYKGIFSYFLNRMINGRKGEPELIKFKGIRTTARQISAEQTGTYINEQPMVLFTIEYEDSQNQTRRAEIKKIVDLLDLGSVKRKTVDIFYLKDNPERIAFVEDLE
ncbi:hypothetical protein CLU96_2695 [Chryseobacterium sp. 52]|uniref:hypothetical protein n=1 Tax=Chryseobacterium sp. 52 TaxID=2035213 RepID=UPI000C195F2F|nr:hypothetical protein [Chryseobacterium sp. 52]PIF45685.1 hypothetical protein CLU96_2695 [Chryseobacterium sp. 52]